MAVAFEPNHARPLEARTVGVDGPGAASIEEIVARRPEEVVPDEASQWRSCEGTIHDTRSTWDPIGRTAWSGRESSW